MTPGSRPELTRRSVLRLCVLAGGAALLAACSGLMPSAATSQPTAAPNNQPRNGGSLRVGVLGDLQGLDGHLTTGLDSLRRVWDVTSQLDDKLNTVPVLAETVDLTPDALQMTVKVRGGVQFHTGRELTSDDLAWNFNRLKDPKVNPIYANLVKPFATIETPDKSTLQVQFDAPDPFVVDALPNLPILDPVSFQQDGPTKPVGTGPYKFVEFVQGDHLTLEKNSNYWAPTRPHLDRLEFRIFTDPQAMMTEVEAGTLDVAIQPSLVDWVRARNERKLQTLINQNSGNYIGAAFNTTKAPTDNKLVRQALQFALNRQQISDTVFQAVEKPLTLLWFPTSPAYDAAKNATYSFDPEKARALLAQSGAGNVAVDFNYPSVSPEFARVGEIWQADLDKVGVKMTLKPTEPVALTASMQRQQYNGVAIGTGFYGQLHGGVVWTSPYYGPINNYAGYKDDKYTQLTLAVYSEADAAKRRPIYDAWNDYVLDQTPVTAISTQLPRAVAQPNVRDAVFSIGGNYLDLSVAWLA
ncbi:MAG: ABC transporter substrate-binding protein [Chloroflexi bacterium]|nr:ABC transporter substrate-binding protein [Chloroflexota bacterium]